MIGVIADDLSGAAELGAVGLSYGLRAEIMLAGEASRDAGLVCVDTDSRSCPAIEARQRATVAAAALTAAGATWIYKKVDSVLRGPILAEIRAVLEHLHRPRALLVPANPAAGRTIQAGQYLISGKPIHETGFRLDPEYPCRTSLVREMMGDTEVQLCARGDRLPPGGVALGEAASPDDLRHWAGLLDEATLPAGAAEFFAAALEARGHSPGFPPPTGSAGVPERRRELFICGSTSQTTREFLERARQLGVPVFTLPAKVGRGTSMTDVERDKLADRIRSAWDSVPRVMLEVGRAPVRTAGGVRGLTDALAEVARAVLRGAGGVDVFAEGGATAASVARCMDWNRFKVERQLAPGVVKLLVPGDLKRSLTVKPGSYAWAAEFSQPASMNTRRARCGSDVVSP